MTSKLERKVGQRDLNFIRGGLETRIYGYEVGDDLRRRRVQAWPDTDEGNEAAYAWLREGKS